MLSLSNHMPDINVLIQRLGNVPHFRGLGEADLRTIILAGSLQHYSAQSLIFLEDEPCAGMYVLLAGEVHLCKLGPQGQQNIVSIIHPVIMFNEVAVLDGGPNPLTAMAMQDSMAWRVSYEAFQDLLTRYPQLGLSLLRVLAHRSRMLVGHYHDLSFLPVLGRVAKLLLELSQSGKQPIQRREIPISQMAARTATVSEAVSRALKELREKDAIQINRATIVVTQPEVLARLAQVEF